VPQSNEANLEEVPEAILTDLTVIPVSAFREVLDVMLIKDDSAPASFVPPLGVEEAGTGAAVSPA
jgi:ATP-dependent Lon protease